MKNTILLFASTIFVLNTNAQEKAQNNFEDWGHKPPLVTTSKPGEAPSDALILFADKLDTWTHIDGEKVEWPASKKGFKVVPGTPSIQTNKSYGSCQLHVEWRIDTKEDHGKKLNWGNSGVYFMGLYEVQIYNSYNDAHKIYYNGQAGAIYKQHAPLVNACRQPGKWERYDIIFTAPEFNEDATLKSPAYFTVMHNGVLIQNHVELKGPTSHTKFTEYKKHPSKLPLMIQSHGSAVEFRNIWMREL